MAHKTDFSKIVQQWAGIRFGMILRQAEIILVDGPKSATQWAEHAIKDAEGEYADYVAEEFWAVEEIRKETIPLVFLSTYSQLEKEMKDITRFICGKTPKDWPDAQNLLNGAGVVVSSNNNEIWDRCKYGTTVNRIRMLVNSYKHNGGKVSKQALSSELATIFKRSFSLIDDIPWAEFFDETKTSTQNDILRRWIRDCMEFTQDLASHIKSWPKKNP